MNQPEVNRNTSESDQTVSTHSTQSSVFVAGQTATTETLVVGQLPLPYCMPLSSIRASLKTTLTEGQLLTVEQWTELLEALYQDVTKYTL